MAEKDASPIDQLEQARKLALGDSHLYTQVVPGVLPIIGPAAALDIRRWGADFLAEAFATPSLPAAQKELLTTDALPTLNSLLDSPAEDTWVVKSVVQTVTSIYPLVFKRVLSNPSEVTLWHTLNAAKLNILQRIDGAPVPIKICCIKFIQKVVQVQTPGLIADPRRPEQNETSIALVPRNHPLLQTANLEAEASGLLDRLLGVFQDASADPILIDATLTCLAVLIRTRAAIANKILSTVLGFNPLKQAAPNMSPRLVVIFRSMEKTTRALLRHVLRTMPNHPLEQKIHAYLMRLQHTRSTLFTEAPSLKRPAEPIDGLDDAKRQRLAGGPRKFPPMPAPPNTFAQLFTLTDDVALQQFDATLLPADIVSNAVFILLKMSEANAVDEAVGAVRARYQHLQKASQPTPVPEIPMAGPTGIDDEDDYDPEFGLGPESTAAPAADQATQELVEPDLDLGPFEMPKPPELSGSEVITLAEQSVSHMLEAMTTAPPPSNAPKEKQGLNRLAARTNDREAWATVMIRVATRTPAAIKEYAETQAQEAPENGDGTVLKSEPTEESPEQGGVGARIRQYLFQYIIDDFRPRINIAIKWLNEEWYCDKIAAKRNPGIEILPNYSRWSIRILERLLPYFDVRDRNLLIRFLSEIPDLDRPILDLVKTLAWDPERINMCILAFQYLLLYRPPTRETVLDVVESIWQEGDAQAKSQTTKVLQKWRPGVLQAEADRSKGVKKEEEKMVGAVAVNGLDSSAPAVEAKTEAVA